MTHSWVEGYESTSLNTLSQYAFNDMETGILCFTFYIMGHGKIVIYAAKLTL